MAGSRRTSGFTEQFRWVAGLLPAILAVTLSAQIINPPGAYYDTRQEVTLTGVVLSVLTAPSQGMIPGSHIVLVTTAGKVDASLGRWGLEGNGALSVAPGQVIEVTGVMKTLLDNPVFVARTAKIGDRIYQLRNEFGNPVSPQARERASQNATQGGVSQ